MHQPQPMGFIERLLRAVDIRLLKPMFPECIPGLCLKPHVRGTRLREWALVQLVPCPLDRLVNQRFPVTSRIREHAQPHILEFQLGDEKIIPLGRRVFPLLVGLQAFPCDLQR